jgi:hypothetical protein
MGMAHNPLRSKKFEARRKGLERRESKGVNFLFFGNINGMKQIVGVLYINMESYA